MGPHHPLAVGATHAKLFTCTTPSLCVATTTQDLASQPSVPVHASVTATEANTQLKPALLRNQPNRSELSPNVPNDIFSHVHTPVNVVHTPVNVVHTPVNVARLASLLATHPDTSFSHYVSDGMSHGFNVGYRGQPPPPPLMASSQSAPNHPSALQNKSFVSSYLMACCESNETAGPFSSPPFSQMYVSGLGTVPKKSGCMNSHWHPQIPRAKTVLIIQTWITSWETF